MVINWLLHLLKPFIMKSRLSSIVKRITEEDSCGLFAVLVVISTLFVVYQITTAFQAQVSDFVAFQQATSISR
jgi:hypothetical protein